ncbi:MAG: hypothetical protein IPJ07_12820 [Acidobacteria bacterium]|nr:hypothetical protein [Acidobacteriota bacterium]
MIPEELTKRVSQAQFCVILRCTGNIVKSGLLSGKNQFLVYLSRSRLDADFAAQIVDKIKKAKEKEQAL